MVLRKFCYFSQKFLKFFRFLGGGDIFKRLKPYVPRFSQTKTWYQNVRKEANFKMSNIKLLGDDRPELYGHFSQKNVEINATQWSKFFQKIFFLEFDPCSILSHMICFISDCFYPGSAFGTALPNNTPIWFRVVNITKCTP